MFALVRGDGATELTLAEVRATPRTAVRRVGGGPLSFEPQTRGLRVTLDEPLEPGVPVAVALDHIEAEA